MTSFKHFVGLTLGIVTNDCIVRQPEGRSQILQATAVPPPDIIVRHIMASQRDALAYTMNVVFGAFKTDIYEVHQKPLLLGVTHGYQRTAARESCLDRETLMILEVQARSLSRSDARKPSGLARTT